MNVGLGITLVGMSSHVEVSPGGIGFIRTAARKASLRDVSALQGVVQRSWLRTESQQSPSTAGAPDTTPK